MTTVCLINETELAEVLNSFNKVHNFDIWYCSNSPYKSIESYLSCCLKLSHFELKKKR